MITKKNFEIMAKIINHELTVDYDLNFNAMFNVAEAFSKNAIKMNPRFNKDKFFKACGFEADEKLV